MITMMSRAGLDSSPKSLYNQTKRHGLRYTEASHFTYTVGQKARASISTRRACDVFTLSTRMAR
jgi:hypothetical protein